MASAYEQFIERELFVERGIDFTDEEQVEIKKVLEKLESTQEGHKWHGLTKEWRRMIVRGIWPRKHRTRDIVALVIEMYDWRKEKNMDNALKTRHPKHDLYHSAWPSYVSGEDIYGHWVQLEKIKEINVKCLDLITREELFECRTQHLEAQMEVKRRVSMRLGTRVCRSVYVIDLKDLSISKQFTPKVKSLLQPLFQISGDMYPDSLWSLYIINAPMSFRMVWRIILPWVDPLVKPKIRLLGGPKQYLAAMVKAGIPLESIPIDIGGKCEMRPMADIIEALVDDPENDQEFTFNRQPGNGTVDILADSQAELDARKEAEVRENRMSMVADDDGDDSIYNEDEVIMEGFLMKMGAVNKALKKRYFVLTPQNLFYFPEKPTGGEKNLRGKIELYMVSKVQRHEETDEKNKAEGDEFRFDVVTPFRTFVLKIPEDETEDKEELLKEWIVNTSEAAAEETCSLDFKDGGTVGVNHIRSGFLHKRGAFNTMYRRRYFVLTGNGFYYFSKSPTEKGSVLKGKIRLGKVQRIEQNTKQKNRFSIVGKTRVYQIRAKDEADAAAWIATLRESVDAYKENVKTRGTFAENMQDVRQIPFVDQVAVLEAESNFEGSGLSIVKNISNLVNSAIQTVADFNVLVDSDTGEKLKGNAGAIGDVVKSALGRVTGMFMGVYSPKEEDNEE